MKKHLHSPIGKKILLQAGSRAWQVRTPRHSVQTVLATLAEAVLFPLFQRWYGHIPLMLMWCWIVPLRLWLHKYLLQLLLMRRLRGLLMHRLVE
jgi:hypothetical protein